MDKSLSGVVIREKIIGESDKMLTILTSEGKIYAYAKGIKNISSKNAPACQVFTYSDFEIVEKNGRNIVKTAYIKEMFYGIRGDMSRYSLACYFSDIMCHVATENNDESENLRLLLNAFFALANKTDIPLWQIKGAFEMRLMSTIGFMPSLNDCQCCGNTAELSINNIFSFEEGGIICSKCCDKSDHIPFSCSVSGKTLQVIAYISGCEISKFLSFKIDDVLSAEFNFLCENYLIHKLEHSFETLRIYKSIAGTLNNITEKNEKQK